MVEEIPQATVLVRAAQEFYYVLRKEVMAGNCYLSEAEQKGLQSHYPVMMQPDRYSSDLTAAIYSSRRAHPLRTILSHRTPIVFDAGCGYGSESFLFAALGARVLAVDASAEQIAIAIKRQRYFEDIFQRQLDITFVNADLDSYILDIPNLSLTWLSSVLHCLTDQDTFLKRIYDGTQYNGSVIITDMSLWNPIFLYQAWRDRRDTYQLGNLIGFLKMLWRKERNG